MKTLILAITLLVLAASAQAQTFKLIEDVDFHMADGSVVVYKAGHRFHCTDVFADSVRTWIKGKPYSIPRTAVIRVPQTMLEAGARQSDIFFGRAEETDTDRLVKELRALRDEVARSERRRR